MTDFIKEAKVTELQNKIRDIIHFATKTALTTVEIKVSSVSNLVKETDYNTKVTEIENKLNNHSHDKYITTPEFNTLAADVFNARLTQTDLKTKIDFDAKLSSLNRKFFKKKSKVLLAEDEFYNLKTFGSRYFRRKNYFENDITQNYLVFQQL